MDLVIMAAGMGSRFGGLKQIEPIDIDGNFIIDYSIFDAIRFGFDKVVFVIKHEIYDIFKETIGKRVEDKIKVEYVFQEIDDLPKDIKKPAERTKPWGTGQAILACKDVVKNDFVIINADDFYGKDAFKVASEFGKVANDNEYALIGYVVKNTLSKNGSAKRGVCKVENGHLIDLLECSVENINGKIFATPLDTNETQEISADSCVSMNMWYLKPSIFDYLEKRFPEFLNDNLTKNPLKCEFLLPVEIGNMVRKNLVSIPVLRTNAVWYGVTYKEDKQSVVDALANLREKGDYPIHLWQKENIVTK